MNFIVAQNTIKLIIGNDLRIFSLCLLVLHIIDLNNLDSLKNI